MTRKVVVVGYQGRMGSMAVELAQTNSAFDYIGGIGSSGSVEVELAQMTPDVVIDLTKPSQVFEHAKIYQKLGIPAIIGTTGLEDNQVLVLAQSAEKLQLGMMILPNFSIAMALLQKCIFQVSPYFDKIEIVESHHPKKIDQPSGSALLTEKNIQYAKHKKEKIPIHSIRLPGILAKQDIVFGSMGETLTLSHQVIDRSAFMPGLALAIEKMKDCNQLIVGLEQVLDL